MEENVELAEELEKEVKYGGGLGGHDIVKSSSPRRKLIDVQGSADRWSEPASSS